MSETAQAPEKAEPKSAKNGPAPVNKASGPHVVYLRRKPIGGHLPKEVQAEAITTLGSIFEFNQPLRGLNDEAEERELLPPLMSVGIQDPHWGTHVRNFWAQMRIKVGFTGKPLEIGLDENGKPLNLMDYVQYRFAKRHRLVAETEAEMLNSPIKRFYIMDPAKETLKENVNVQLGKRADREFIKLSEDPERMRDVLQVLSPMIRTMSLQPSEVENALFKLKSTEARKFITAIEDKTLSIRADLYRFISAGVVLKVGTSYSFHSDTIGNSEEETLIWMQNPRNAASVNAMRNLYRDALR